MPMCSLLGECDPTGSGELHRYNLKVAVITDQSKNHIPAANQGRVQQLSGRIIQTIRTAYVRQVSCWTTFILIQ